MGDGCECLGKPLGGMPDGLFESCKELMLGVGAYI